MEYKYKWLCKYDKIKNQTKYYQLAREATAEDNGEMYFENIDSATGTFTLAKTGSPTHIPNLEYRLDKGNWTTYDMNTLPSIEVPSGAKIYFRGDNSSTERFNANISNYFSFSMTAKHNVGGYITSLLVKEGFKDFEYTKSASYSLSYIFKGNTNLVNANSLVLSINNLQKYCYYYMLSSCGSLVTAPELPATTLAEKCYQGMLSSCVSLVTAPELPATTLAEGCYNGMFMSCVSLVTAPELPATTMAIRCYMQMFQNCYSLTTAPELPATTLAQYCYSYMFNGCTSLTTAPELPATTLAKQCYTSMFSGCTSLTTAPELPATTLTMDCYSSMFSGCWALTTAPALPATTLAAYCYSSMFYGCTSLTTAPELPATTLAIYCYEKMFNSCSKLNSVTALFETYDSTACTNWLIGVASTGTFTKLPGVGIPEGTSGIPTGWTVKEYVKPVEMYFENIAGETGMFSLKKTGAPSNTPNLEYKIDNDEWTNYDTTTLPEVSVPSGSKIYFRGNNTTFNNTTSTDYFSFNMTSQHNVGGYITSLIFNDSFAEFDLTYYTMPSGIFCNLFRDDTNLINAKYLVMNINKLSNNCYYYMFYGCSALTTAPELPATTLADACYSNMFGYCTSLITAPELPATVLAMYCYDSMFSGCNLLSYAPELPATTLVAGCYQYMFSLCYNLNSLTALFETYNSSACSRWLVNVSSTGTFTKRQGVEIPSGANGIPTGWTVVDV